MDFGIIRRHKGEISLEEWEPLIAMHPALRQAPPRKGVNPFTGKEVIFSGTGVAHYLVNGSPSGNICLENGELLTTGVPQSLCAELALQLGAEVHEDDRS